MSLKKDEFDFLWGEVQKLQKKVTELEEAVNTLIGYTPEIDGRVSQLQQHIIELYKRTKK
jgi:hypothetical protein